MTRSNRFRAGLVAGVATLLLAACSGADGGDSKGGGETAASDDEIHATADMHMVATTALREAMKDSFDQGQVDMLNAVAHQQVVAGHCEGFEIDPERMKVEMNRLHHGPDGKQLDISADQLAQLEKKALLGLGMAVGSQLMIAEMDMKGFCEAAESERESGADAAHVIYKRPAAAS